MRFISFFQDSGDQKILDCSPRRLAWHGNSSFTIYLQSSFNNIHRFILFLCLIEYRCKWGKGESLLCHCCYFGWSCFMITAFLSCSCLKSGDLVSWVLTISKLRNTIKFWKRRKSTGLKRHLAESEKSFRLFEVIKSKLNIFAIGRQNKTVSSFPIMIRCLTHQQGQNRCKVTEPLRCNHLMNKI